MPGGINGGIPEGILQEISGEISVGINERLLGEIPERYPGGITVGIKKKSRRKRRHEL